MFEKLKDFQVSLLGLFLALGIIAGSLIVTDKMSKDSVSVTGSAFEIVKSDSAEWSFRVAVKNSNKQAAYKELQKNTPIVKQYLISKGIKAEQIDVIPVSIYETYKTAPNGVSTNEVEYYNVSQEYKVSSDNVELVKTISNEITELVEQGIDISSYNPEYQYSKMADLKVKLLESATADAKNRAESMLKSNRNKVGKIRSVKMGVFQITTPNSNSVTDYGINDSSTIDKKVTAVANVVFSIK